jgi:hypothetical protein
VREVDDSALVGEVAASSPIDVSSLATEEQAHLLRIAHWLIEHPTSETKR